MRVIIHFQHVNSKDLLFSDEMQLCYLNGFIIEASKRFAAIKCSNIAGIIEQHPMFEQKNK